MSLELLEKLGGGNGLYQCSCGTQKVMRCANVNRGLSKSCGCWNIQAIKQRSTKHGHSSGGVRTRTYLAWKEMRRRCFDPKRKCYKDYGGRGITICERWDSYENFLADMGECPDGLTLERKDVNGNYCPENCCWADCVTQANNKRSSHLITAFGKTQTLAEWAKETGIKIGTVRCRIVDLGWEPEKALTQTVRPMNTPQPEPIKYEPFVYPF